MVIFSITGGKFIDCQNQVSHFSGFEATAQVTGHSSFQPMIADSVKMIHSVAVTIFWVNRHDGDPVIRYQDRLATHHGKFPSLNTDNQARRDCYANT